MILAIAAFISEDEPHFSSITSRIVLAISRITIAFMTNALIPISFLM